MTCSCNCELGLERNQSLRGLETTAIELRSDGGSHTPTSHSFGRDGSSYEPRVPPPRRAGTRVTSPRAGPTVHWELRRRYWLLDVAWGSINSETA